MAELLAARWLWTYRREWLRSDAVAGVMRAAYAIPLSTAYASLAGFAPQTGFYCYLLGGLACAIFIHLPAEPLTSRKRRLNPDGFDWNAVLAATGRPGRFE